MLSSDSIGGSWRTGAKPASGSPPTRRVGLSAVASSGCAASSADELGHQAVELAVGDLRPAEGVVEALVALDLAAQLRGAARRVASQARGSGCGPGLETWPAPWPILPTSCSSAP